MRPILTIWKKEMRVYFVSPIAYVFLAAFLFLAGLFFYLGITLTGEASLRVLSGNLAIVQLFILPMLTMRHFAEERRQGTLELLMTAPIPAGSLVVDSAGCGRSMGVGLSVWGFRVWEAPTAGEACAGLAVGPPSLLDTSPGPLSSAVSYWDEHREPVPPGGNLTAEDNGTHGSMRKRDSVIDQIIHFYDTGEIIQTCTSGGMPAACDCPKTTEGDATCGPAAF